MLFAESRHFRRLRALCLGTRTLPSRHGSGRGDAAEVPVPARGVRVRKRADLATNVGVVGWGGAKLLRGENQHGKFLAHHVIA